MSVTAITPSSDRTLSSELFHEIAKPASDALVVFNVTSVEITVLPSSDNVTPGSSVPIVPLGYTTALSSS